ncbi:hypothetical protein M409DRAFT_67175 [Zasmidium cellare ATCC 36951]|uniref:NADH:flavin oxidoreductase/NADH oxidase N-terminal domain-containing protein n=1 Tax=Zasmidium cellare ATCC 36951 TaxID=1080233 RepID=A0A6A6CGI7_ZASCE|nr:uncharacterized protein M409DRAFT_67175 [Zasmidium cellare ATCC 36951]KAF2165300.1 hypothetical protein M409DRAFT_67175 [Zasmidium cellare ATCC 36951]
MADSGLFQSFQLPNGTRLKNRTAKAAMEENLADVKNHNAPSKELVRLYRVFGAGGAGLILSGHVMIDPYAVALPGDVVLADDIPNFDPLPWKEWISATQNGGAQFWLQINQPGRQIKKGAGLPVYGPSAVPMEMGSGSLNKMFDTPREMSESQIQGVVERFVWTARKAEALGADGVEIHAAHGYLVSQFLSPLWNKRTDRWGGTLENRARLLFEVIRAVRAAVSPKFGVGVKINSADYQRGGFGPDDLTWVATRLKDMGLDLIEISGGSHESPAMTGTHAKKPQRKSTQEREAYFLEAARKLKEITTIPLMVTGGIRSRKTAEQVIASGDNLIAGIGTAIGLMPDLVERWKRGEDPAPHTASSWVLSGKLTSAGQIACVQYNLHRTANGRSRWVGVWPLLAVIIFLLNENSQAKASRKWVHVLKDAKAQ